MIKHETLLSFATALFILLLLPWQPSVFIYLYKCVFKGLAESLLPCFCTAHFVRGDGLGDIFPFRFLRVTIVKHQTETTSPALNLKLSRQSSLRRSRGELRRQV